MYIFYQNLIINRMLNLSKAFPGFLLYINYFIVIHRLICMGYINLTPTSLKSRIKDEREEKNL